MTFEVADDVRRDGDGAHPGRRLGRTDHSQTVGQLLALFLDPDRAVQEVDAVSPQGEQLPQSQAAEGRQQDVGGASGWRCKIGDHPGDHRRRITTARPDRRLPSASFLHERVGVTGNRIVGRDVP